MHPGLHASKVTCIQGYMHPGLHASILFYAWLMYTHQLTQESLLFLRVFPACVCATDTWLFCISGKPWFL